MPVAAEVVERQDPEPVVPGGPGDQHHVVGERLDPLEPLVRGPRSRTADHAVASWSPSRGTGQLASRNSVAPSLVTTSRASVAVRAHDVLGVVLHAAAAPAHGPRQGRAGRCASTTQTSRVSRLSAQITTRPPLRVARTSSSNCSSGSSSTSTSSSTGRADRVPPDLVGPVGLVVDGVEEVRRSPRSTRRRSSCAGPPRPGRARWRGRGSAARRPRRRPGRPTRPAAGRPG